MAGEFSSNSQLPSSFVATQMSPTVDVSAASNLSTDYYVPMLEIDTEEFVQRYNVKCKVLVAR